MALRVNTNVEALNVHNTLVTTNNRVAESLKRLSSGMRINSAKDDASGLAVANNFRAKISSMRVASQNAAEANSMLQVADGAYSKITDILVRMRDLATQAASGQTEQRDKLQKEFEALQGEINRIAGSTKYGDMTLTNSDSSTGTTYTFQVGSGISTEYDVLTMNFSSVSTGALGVGATGASAISIGLPGSATSAMDAIDKALSKMNSYMANVGAYQNRLQYTIENLAVSIENFSASESAIRDADMAYEMTQFTKNQILQQTGIAMLSQANQAPQQIMQLIGG